MLPFSSVELTEISVDDLELKWECLEQFRLGRGGFADVFHVFYKGYDAVLKKPRKDYDVRERVETLREARIIAALSNCENVVRLYGICEFFPFCGMIMEYCAGPNLSDLVFKLFESEVKLETIRIFKWCHALTKTLCELNTTHYHGDVKALNVLVKERPCCCQDGKYEDVLVNDRTYKLCVDCKGVHLEYLSLKLCDFGMAGEHGTRRRFPGTPEFSAPETEMKEEYTEKSEVYSFGHLMLQLVIGMPTDQCAPGQRRFLELYNNKKYDLSRIQSNSICETITWCLDKVPENRPKFTELLDKLNNRFDHYTSLRDNRDAAANKEREEFLDHYKLSRKITMAQRTITTSTFLSISTDDESNSQSDIPAMFHGGPLDNDVFEESPLPSPTTSRKFGEGFELTRNFVENSIYMGDESSRTFILPPKRRRTNFMLKYLVQAKDLISSKINRLVRRRH